MRPFLTSLFLSLSLVLSGMAAAAETAAPQDAKTGTDSVAPDLVDAILDKTGDEVILAGYKNFASATAKLKSGFDHLCSAPSGAALIDVQNAYSEVVVEWSKMEVIKIGPVLKDNGQERILFYPDKSGSGLKQITAALSAKDEAVLKPEKMQGASVALQGLGALDYVLFGMGSEGLTSSEGAYRCKFGAAVAERLSVQSETLKSEWAKDDGILHDFKHPSPSNPLFQTDKQAVTALLGTLVHGLDMVRKQRIAPFYSAKDPAANPKKAIYGRSGNTMTSIAANLEGLAGLWVKSDMTTLLKGDATAYGGNIEFNFKSAIMAAKAVNLPLDQAVADEKQRAKLDFLMLTIADLYKLLSEDVGKAIGLGAGFSFSDGD
jgi:uncharacterized protein